MYLCWCDGGAPNQTVMMTGHVALDPGQQLGQAFKRLRETEFPWTAETTYINNASVGPIPERTRRAVDAFNARRTAPYLLPDRDLLDVLRNARRAAARLINADEDEIGLATNTGHGINLAATALPLRDGDIVLLSDREFPANVYPWLRLAHRGVVTEFVPNTPEGWPDENRLLERLADPRVRVLSASFVHFSNGFRLDLKRLGEACREHSTFFVVDGIQGVGQVPIDMKQCSVDILACGGQKWLMSPWGSGFVYVRKELVNVLEPVVSGWMAFEGTDDFSRLTAYDPTFRNDARRFEMVTLPYQDFVGMSASLEMLTEVGVDRIAGYLETVREPLLQAADSTDRITIASSTDASRASGIVCVAVDRLVETYHRLAQNNVVCSLREGTIRFSPHCYNTPEEMSRVASLLAGE